MYTRKYSDRRCSRKLTDLSFCFVLVRTWMHYTWLNMFISHFVCFPPLFYSTKLARALQCSYSKWRKHSSWSTYKAGSDWRQKILIWSCKSRSAANDDNLTASGGLKQSPLHPAHSGLHHMSLGTFSITFDEKHVIPAFFLSATSWRCCAFCALVDGCLTEPDCRDSCQILPAAECLLFHNHGGWWLPLIPLQGASHFVGAVFDFHFVTGDGLMWFLVIMERPSTLWSWAAVFVCIISGKDWHYLTALDSSTTGFTAWGGEWNEDPECDGIMCRVSAVVGLPTTLFTWAAMLVSSIGEKITGPWLQWIPVLLAVLSRGWNELWQSTWVGASTSFG